MKEETEKKIYTKIPVIILKGVVVFPDNKIHFDIIKKSSVIAAEKAMKKDQKVFFVTQQDKFEGEPTISDIYNTGVVGKICQLVKENKDIIKVFVETEEKAQIINIRNKNNFFEADVEVCSKTMSSDGDYAKGLVRTAKDMMKRYCEILRKDPEEIAAKLLANQDSVFVAHYIALNTSISTEAKQAILCSDDDVEKLDLLLEALSEEINLILLEEQILNKVYQKMDKNQRDYFLREQMKVISQELDEEIGFDEKQKYEEKILKLSLKKSAEEKLLEETKKMQKMSASSPEAVNIRTYLDICLDLPWKKTTKDKIDTEKAKKILDKDHYGLDEIKQRIIEFLSVKKLNSEINSQVLCFCGPPGVGKTSIAKSVAKAMGRKYVKISLGGVKDESEIRGHRKTYIGSMPGRIINAIKTAGVKNPLILLDEIDKMSNDFRGDPASAMLEVLDTEQNSEFVDHYLEIPFDLSDVIFIATANDKYSIPAPLLDRLEIIDVNSYTENEKFYIAQNHLIPKQMKLHGLTVKDVKFTDEVIFDLINCFTLEAGVRSLERCIAQILRKIVRKKVESEITKKIIITQEDLLEYLGPKKYKKQKLLSKDEVGIVTGLAWTSFGGEIMNIEVSALAGTGKIELTGNLGDVMKESAKTAISYIRSQSENLGIDKDFYKNKDVHIHVPEGAVPKDGPSAGVTICTAIISELTKIPVKKDVAMTGEITLRGRVLPIGGLKEKTIAAYKSGVKTIFILEENRADLHKIDSVIKEKINFITVKNFKEILPHALVQPQK